MFYSGGRRRRGGGRGVLTAVAAVPLFHADDASGAAGAGPGPGAGAGRCGNDGSRVVAAVTHETSV